MRDADVGGDLRGLPRDRVRDVLVGHAGAGLVGNDDLTRQIRRRGGRGVLRHRGRCGGLGRLVVAVLVVLVAVVVAAGAGDVWDTNHENADHDDRDQGLPELVHFCISWGSSLCWGGDIPLGYGTRTNTYF